MKTTKGKIIIISIISVLILSAFLVSTTFAKYISQIDLADEARVAKWDVRFLDAGDSEIVKMDLFKDSYLCDSTGQNCFVKSLNEENDKIVAPGTKGEYTFKVLTDTEARYRIKLNVVDADDTIGQIEYKLNGEPCVCDEAVGINCLAERISEDIFNNATEFEPGSNTEINKIEWEWKFEKGEGEAKDANDVKDTDLGKQAKISSNYGNQAHVKFSFKITVEQVTKDDN